MRTGSGVETSGSFQACLDCAAHSPDTRTRIETLTRRAGTYPTSGVGRFSRLSDKANRCLTPIQRKHLVHLTAAMSGGHAGMMHQRLRRVQICEAMVRRLSEQAGAYRDAVQTAWRQQPASNEAYRPILHCRTCGSEGVGMPVIGDSGLF